MAGRFFRHPPADCDISPEGKYVTDSRFGKGPFEKHDIFDFGEKYPTLMITYHTTWLFCLTCMIL